MIKILPILAPFIILILGGILIWLLKPKEKTKKVKTSAKPHDENEHNDGEYNENTEHSKKLSVFRWLIDLAIVIIVMSVAVVLAGSAFKKCSRETKEFFEPPRKEYVEIDVEDRTIDVKFKGEYSETIYLPQGYGISFRNEFGPFCVKNGAGFEVCGNTGKEVGRSLPSMKENCELSFKTKNGAKQGFVTIVLWRKERRIKN